MTTLWRWGRKAWWAAVLLLSVCCWWWWPHIRNEFFVLLGSRNEAGGWYGFHSGAGGAFYTSAIPTALIFYYHHTCHNSALCLRWGKYEAAGGIFKLCAVHHPDVDRTVPRSELIARLHAEHKNRRHHDAP